MVDIAQLQKTDTGLFWVDFFSERARHFPEDRHADATQFQKLQSENWDVLLRAMINSLSK